MANSPFLQAGLTGLRTYSPVFLRAARSLHSTTVQANHVVRTSLVLWVKTSLQESPVVKTADTYELLWIKLEAYKQPIFIGSAYHPPKPIYNTNSFVDYLEATIDVINSTSPSSLIILACDLNQLSDDLIVKRTGLISIVKGPTIGDNYLDRIYISIDSYQQTK